MVKTLEPMTTGSISKRMIAFALPLLLGNLFQQLYNTVDSLIVGNFLGSSALAAVSSSGSLISMLIGFLSGIAIGAGTDIAIDSADVVLMKSDLLDAVTAVQLSKKVIRNIKENLFWAFCYNAICIPVAAGVFYPLFHLQLSPMLASAAMSLSSVCVVSNALRLRRFRPTKSNTPAVCKNTCCELKGEEPTMTQTIHIQGMMCPHCVSHVTQALNAIPGVSAQVDLESGTATVTGDVSADTLKAAVEGAPVWAALLLS